MIDCKSVARLMRNCSGGTLIWFALTLPVIFGVAGIGIDAVLWYMDKRIIQTAVDSSVIAGALLALQDATDAEILAAVKEEIARNDFQATTDDVIVVNVPPLSGPNAGVAGFVEVIITKARPLYFAGFIHEAPVFIQARAVSGTSGVGSHCILALDETIDGAIEFGGTANADINCGVASNSQSDSAIDLNGGAVLKADSIQAFGDFEVSNNASLDTAKPQPYSTRVNDPYADLDVPARLERQSGLFPGFQKVIFGPDADGSPPGHGLVRVNDKVVYDLGDLSLVHFHRHKVRGTIEPAFHIGATEGETRGIFDQVGDGGGCFNGGSALGEGQQLLGQISRSQAGFLCLDKPLLNSIFILLCFADVPGK